MSSDEENDELNYGINDQDRSYAKGIISKSLNSRPQKEDPFENYDDNDDDSFEKRATSNDPVPKYEKNPKKTFKNNATKDEVEDSKNAPLEDLLDLIQQEDNDQEDQSNKSLEDLLNLMKSDDEEGPEEKHQRQKNDSRNSERKKITIKRDKPATMPVVESKSSQNSPKNKEIPSFAPNSIASQPEQENIYTEKNTGIRLIKSDFKSEIEMNAMLACNHGKFYKLTELGRRSEELKSQNSEFYSIFIMGSKTESKCSAKGNSYIIWTLHDLGNLERQQEISLFLFGSAYKTHWKSNEFSCFALIKPEFLNSNSNQNSNSTNQAKKQDTSWNNFASKTLNQNQKLTLSVKAESQLLYLGQVKDITYCKSVSKTKPSDDVPRKCKNLVNLEKGSPYCVYHCIQLDKANRNGSNFGKYNMNRPTSIPSASLNSNTQLFNPYGFNNNRPAPSLIQSQREAAAKLAKEMKEQTLRSLNSNITETLSSSSSILSSTNVMLNTISTNKTKKSDKEMLAMLDGKQLDRDELLKIRTAEQQTVNFQKSTILEESNKELKKLFSSKILLKGELIANSSISSQKLVEIKKENVLLSSGGSDSLASKLKVSYEDKKKNFALSSKQSHREIVKELKDKKKEDKIEKKNEESKKLDKKVDVNTSKSSSIIASSFLQNRIAEIKKFNSPSSNRTSQPTSNGVSSQKNIGFDLELFIGDAPTSKKLLDVSDKYSLSSLKRKAPETVENLSQKKESIGEIRAKKLKMIEELQSIKSSHSKDVMNPDKNPHFKSYLEHLQQQEDVDNKLTQLRNREVKVVTCPICNYTAFSQSSYCKTEKHHIARRDVLQRFFRCKSCKEKTYTLDKVCPSTACTKCGSEKFEPCAMKDDTSAQNVLVNVTTNLDFDAL